MKQTAVTAGFYVDPNTVAVDPVLFQGYEYTYTMGGAGFASSGLPATFTMTSSKWGDPATLGIRLGFLPEVDGDVHHLGDYAETIALCKGTTAQLTAGGVVYEVPTEAFITTQAKRMYKELFPEAYGVDFTGWGVRVEWYEGLEINVFPPDHLPEVAHDSTDPKAGEYIKITDEELGSGHLCTSCEGDMGMVSAIHPKSPTGETVAYICPNCSMVYFTFSTSRDLEALTFILDNHTLEN